MTPLQPHEAHVGVAGGDAPGSGAFVPGAFGSPQLGSMLANPQHWPSAHMQCMAGGGL